MRIRNWFYLSLLVVLIGCSNDKKVPVQQNLSPMANLQNLPKTTVPMGPPPVGGLNPKHGEPGHRCDLAVGAKLPSNTAQASQPIATVVPTTPESVPQATAPTAPGMNPPHGQPNHRCDIAVGAPLNSKPTPTTATTSKPVVQTVMPSATTTVPQVNAKGEKLNPPHGQPNHRCDIAVGAPLNSKPTPTAATTSKPVVQTVTPSTNTTVPQVNAKGEKLNPPHGQPNHRCDIAVGAPLT